MPSRYLTKTLKFEWVGYQSLTFLESQRVIEMLTVFLGTVRAKFYTLLQQSKSVFLCNPFNPQQISDKLWTFAKTKGHITILKFNLGIIKWPYCLSKVSSCWVKACAVRYIVAFSYQISKGHVNFVEAIFDQAEMLFCTNHVMECEKSRA